MSKVINRNDLSNARYTMQLVSPAIEALGKITPHAVGCVEAHEKVVEFGAWLQEFVAKAEAVIDQAQRQYDNRPQRIITAASIRFNSIPEDIEREQKSSENKTAAHKTKSEELRKQNFSESEIQAILPFPQKEIDAHADAITGLQNEQKNLQSFLTSAPVYNTDLLDMSKLAPFMQHCKSVE
jgi:hypothetical protein